VAYVGLLPFGYQFNKSPYCFSTRWVGPAAAPVVYRTQKLRILKKQFRPFVPS